MNAHADFPSFDVEFEELNQFILTLVDEYSNGNIRSWDDLEERVKAFYAPETMDFIESKAPGWKRMASYSDGITLTHATCVLLGLFMLPEFLALNAEQQQLAKWIVLFHDIEKIFIPGKRDHPHGFRSAVTAAKALRDVGFHVTDKFDSIIQPWSELTNLAADQILNSAGEQISDNEQLPTIISGIDKMYGIHAPAALIVKGVLFHMSIEVVKEWPQPSPLTDEEAVRFIDEDLLPLIKVMHLADTNGWMLFEPDQESYKSEILDVFQRVEALISHSM